MLLIEMALWVAAQPSTIGPLKDWASTFLAIAAVLVVIYGYAKSIAKWNGLETDFTKSLNGIGERIKAVEVALERMDARADLLDRTQDRAADDRTRIHERLGKAEKSAEDCGDNIDQTRADIAGRVNDMRLYGDREFAKLRERLASIEKEIDIRLRGNGRNQ